MGGPGGERREMATTFADQLTRWMDEDEWTEESLAAAVTEQGIRTSQQSVSKWKRGETRPDPIRAAALARAMGKSDVQINDALGPAPKTRVEVGADAAPSQDLVTTLLHRIGQLEEQASQRERKVREREARVRQLETQVSRLERLLTELERQLPPPE